MAVLLLPSRVRPEDPGHRRDRHRRRAAAIRCRRLVQLDTAPGEAGFRLRHQRDSDEPGHDPGFRLAHRRDQQNPRKTHVSDAGRSDPADRLRHRVRRQASRRRTRGQRQKTTTAFAQVRRPQIPPAGTANGFTTRVFCFSHDFPEHWRASATSKPMPDLNVDELHSSLPVKLTRNS
uniref:Uncharacterized protein n=1 Tax=Panagrolaimus sp. JU765 TaxID=591449 RepID=A0AC34R5T0_9BILA